MLNFIGQEGVFKFLLVMPDTFEVSKKLIKIPVVGVEPTRSCPHQILSLARLPIPPYRH